MACSRQSSGRVLLLLAAALLLHGSVAIAQTSSAPAQPASPVVPAPVVPVPVVDALAPAGVAVKQPRILSWPAPSEREQQLLDVLSSRVQMKLSTRLDAVAPLLTQWHGVNFVLDKKNLTDERVRLDTMVSISANNISLDAALRKMLKPLQLTYILEHEVILITTESRAAGQNQTRVYSTVGVVAAGEEAALARQIANRVAPATWENGGGGTISPLARARCLVVCQSPDVHQEIMAFLSQSSAASGEKSERPAATPSPARPPLAR